MSGFPFLDYMVHHPLLGFLMLLFVRRNNPSASRNGALIISLLIFVLSLGLLAPYWYQYPAGSTFERNEIWISSPEIRYHVALDGLSLWLVLLTTLLTSIAVAG